MSFIQAAHITNSVTSTELCNALLVGKNGILHHDLVPILFSHATFFNIT